MVFIGYCVGQFCGPQFFKSSEAPHYATAFNAIFATVTIMIALQITLAYVSSLLLNEMVQA